MAELIITGALFAVPLTILYGWRRGLRRMRRELEAAQRGQQREV